MKKYHLLWSISILAILISVFMYEKMPDEMPIHWNAKGEVDGTASKTFALFFLPVMMLGMTLLFIYLPRIDPKWKNWESFLNYYYGFIALFLFYFLSIHLVTIAWALDYRISLLVVLAIGIGALMLYIGKLLSVARQNWFLGIRTPWTLSDEEVWNKTHEMGAKLFYGSGLLILLSAFIPQYFVWITLATLIPTSLITVIYSYVLYQRRHPKPENN